MNEWFIYSVIAILLIMFYFRGRSEVVRVTSGVNGRSYLVQDLPDKHLAADTLADLQDKFQHLIKLLEQTDEHPGVKRLAKHFKGNIAEKTRDSRYTSYTINKGEQVHMCIRHADNSLVDRNTIFFVGLHELAHIMTVTHGHTDEFRQNFKFLVQRALDFRLYEYEAYHLKGRDYCGIQIRNTPLK